jgi:hypothetical protein
MSKPKHKPETNTQFITRLMEFSPYGVLSQMFIISAIDHYSRVVGAAPPLDNFVVNGEAWKETAKWIQDEFNKR